MSFVLLSQSRASGMNHVPDSAASLETVVHWQAPRDDESLLIAPKLGDFPACLAENQSLLARFETGDFSGIWKSIRQLARREILDAARNFTADFDARFCMQRRQCPEISPNNPILASGHQPELFHPGVLFKNILLNRLAEKHRMIGLNLIIDNDLCDSVELAVPVREASCTVRKGLAFDEPLPSQPWEERRLRNPRLWNAFPQRLAEIDVLASNASLVHDSATWPELEAAESPAFQLWELTTAVRRRWELRNDLGNLEIPMSALCATTSFQKFLIAIVERIREFVPIYNEAVAEYRRINRVRNQRHPVPNLELRTEAVSEAPFWVWRAGDQRRDPLRVRIAEGSLILSDSRGELCCWKPGDVSAAVQALKRLTDEGIRLRPRALTTTLFVRWFVADLFIQGIGGAKYDEITDAIAAKFFHSQPPKSITATATLHLPIPPVPASSDREFGELRWRLNDCERNPERHLPEPIREDVRSIVEELRSLRNRVAASPEDRKQRFHRRKELRGQLLAEMKSVRDLYRSQINLLTEQRASARIQQSREYAFVLFPEWKLRRVCDLLDDEFSHIPTAAH